MAKKDEEKKAPEATEEVKPAEKPKKVVRTEVLHNLATLDGGALQTALDGLGLQTRQAISLASNDMPRFEQHYDRQALDTIEKEHGKLEEQIADIAARAAVLTQTMQAFNARPVQVKPRAWQSQDRQAQMPSND